MNLEFANLRVNLDSYIDQNAFNVTVTFDIVGLMHQLKNLPSS